MTMIATHVHDDDERKHNDNLTKAYGSDAFGKALRGISAIPNYDYVSFNKIVIGIFTLTT